MAGKVGWVGLEELVFLADRVTKIISVKVMPADACLECSFGVSVEKCLSQQGLDPGI